MEYHVRKSGDDSQKGTAGSPFLTIGHAAEKAIPGDIITVHEGIYREQIDPPRGGESGVRRITYRAAEGETVSIKGSEVIDNWKHQDGDVWMVTLSNDYFGAFNPYSNLLGGDWFFPQGRKHHSGAVYLNDQALNEADVLESLHAGSGRKWFGKTDNLGTHIWISCGGLDPNEELTEINVRQSVFYPSQPGINYLTVQGFVLSQAATPWSPPTTEQIGLIGTNWSKGWIIENNTITHSRCSGITLGKYFDREDGRLEYGYNAHYQTVKRVLARGDWTKENVGGHIVRNNHIAFCEQTGIVGSHGAAFCEIYGNEIHHIHARRLFGGFEQAGIKFHAPVDTVIRDNLIYDCWMGVWLDWMNQGVRFSGNILYDNNQWDLFIEISHGPVLVDNNIMLSSISLYDSAQGGAYGHNLFGGEIRQREEGQRLTPYFRPHSTELVGESKVFDGDDRFYNNIILGEGGLAHYDDNEGEIVVEGNVYLYKASPSGRDSQGRCFPRGDTRFHIVREDNHLYLEMALDKAWGLKGREGLIDSEILGRTEVAGQRFENPDGTAITLNTDFHGAERDSDMPFPGPFELSESVGRIKIWTFSAGSLCNDAHEVEDR